MATDRTVEWYAWAAKVLADAPDWRSAALVLEVTPDAARNLAARLRPLGWQIPSKGKGGRPKLPDRNAMAG